MRMRPTSIGQTSQPQNDLPPEPPLSPPQASVEAMDCADDVELGDGTIPTIELSSSYEDVCHGESDSTTMEPRAPVDSHEIVTMGCVVSMDGRTPVETEEEEPKRGEFISATIIKPSIGTELGLSFRSLPDDSGFYISQIKKTGLIYMSGAPFHEGDKAISIQNKSCDQMDHKAAANLLREALGFVTIVVQDPTGNGDPCIVETMISKPSPTSRAGIGFSQSTEHPSRSKINVCSIFFNGLFATSLLSVGDEVIKINELPCRNLDPSAAADIIKSAPHYVTIIAKKFQWNGVVVASGERPPSRMKRCLSRTVGRLCQILFALVFVAALVTLILVVVKAN